jgi:hypothetical protein
MIISQEKKYDIMNTFSTIRKDLLNMKQIYAQQVVDIVISLQLNVNSRICIFVNTSPT